MSDVPPPARPDLYVVARFLDRLVDSPEGIARPKLQAAVRLNYDLYRSYLALLIDRGYARVEEDKNGGQRVAITDAGRAAHERLVGWIRDAFGDVRL